MVDQRELSGLLQLEAFLFLKQIKVNKLFKCAIKKDIQMKEALHSRNLGCEENTYVTLVGLSFVYC